MSPTFRQHVGDMKKVANFEQTCLFWPTRDMLLSTFLCRGTFVLRYVHPVPTYILLYVKNRLSPFLTKHSPNNNQLPAPPLLLSRFGLWLSYLSPLPTPISPLLSPLLFPLQLVWFVAVLSHRPGVLPRCAASSCLVSSSRRISSRRVSSRRVSSRRISSCCFAASSPLAAPALFGWL